MKSLTSIAAIALLAAGLAACADREREAESKTPVAEAEVQTTLPETAISDTALQNAADRAAAEASTTVPGAPPTVPPASDAPPTQ